MTEPEWQPLMIFACINARMHMDERASLMLCAPQDSSYSSLAGAATAGGVIKLSRLTSGSEFALDGCGVNFCLFTFAKTIFLSHHLQQHG